MGISTASQPQVGGFPVVAQLNGAPLKWLRMIRRISATLGFLLLVFAAAGFLGGASSVGAATPPGGSEPPARGFVFSYAVKVKMPAKSHKVHARIPLPATDEFQTISELRLQAPEGVVIHEDSGVGPHYLDFTADPARVKGPFEVHVTFTVVRYERRVNLTAAVDPQVALPAPGLPNDVVPFLHADPWSPGGESIKAIARIETDGVTNPLEKARKIFDYVVLAAGGPAQERGASNTMCESGGAECAGLNSSFVSVARAAGIPARLEIGFSFPDGEKEGAVSGYHSWAEFFVNGMGWVALDASQAAMEPEKRDDFFGSIDARRVMIAGGRDSLVSALPAPRMAARRSVTLRAGRLNDLVDPQVDVDGKPFSRYSAEFLFQEADIAGPTSSSRRPVYARGYVPEDVVAGS